MEKLNQIRQIKVVEDGDEAEKLIANGWILLCVAPGAEDLGNGILKPYFGYSLGSTEKVQPTDHTENRGKFSTTYK